MKYFRLVIVLSFSIFLLFGCSNQDENKKTITISAAASLNGALTELKEQFENEYPQIELLLNFGGSGSLQQQIKQGAPVDLFFSAAEAPFLELVEEEFIDSTNYSPIVQNTLVLIASKDKQIGSLKDLEDKQIGKVAIGTPESVPAGQYAKQTLISYQLWDSLQPKLILAKDVRQVLTYVETGNVDAGFVYRTDVANSDKVQTIKEIPANQHEPIVYPAGIVKSTKSMEEALLFYQFLKSDASRQIFEKYGFRTLE